MWKEFLAQNNISDRIEKVIQMLNFDKITKVQQVVIPHFVANKDVIVKAATGSGKTLSFLVPLFNYLSKFAQPEPVVYSIIMLPTRELAKQVYAVTAIFMKEFPEFTCELMTGGGEVQIDYTKYIVPNIIIGTPGRVFQVLEESKLSLKKVEMFILDEADKMLDQGFEHKILTIIERLPKMRRTSVFSATMNAKIDNVAKCGLRNPIYIDVTIDDIFAKVEERDTKIYLNYKEKGDEISKIYNEIPINLTNDFMIVGDLQKLPLIVKMIKDNPIKKFIIFFASCNCVDFYSYALNHFLKDAVPIFKLHGKIDQKKRNKQYSEFSKSVNGIMLSTDLAARGIDVPDVSAIIQFDPPKNEEIFVHRVGRTARAGKCGESLLFLRNNEVNFIKYLGLKGIKVNERKFEVLEQLTEELKDFYRTDKLMYDKAVKSFVSYVKFYSEHDLKYIFDIKTLKLGELASGYGLFRLPRVKEILGKKVTGFEQDKFNPSNIEYKDDNAAKMNDKKEEYLFK